MFKKISLGLIKSDPDLMFRERKEYESSADLESLKKSIQRQELIHPLQVQEAENGEYRLLTGIRRYHALRQLEKENGKDIDVMVRIVPADMPERDRLKLIAEENEMRKGFSQKETARYLKAMDKAGFGVPEIATLFGKHERTIQRIMKVVKDDFFFDWVLDGTIKYSQASKLMNEISQEKHSILKDTLRRWKEKTDREIADIRRRYDDKKKKPPKAKVEHHNYLYQWLMNLWISDIEKGIEPLIDGDWSYPLMYEPEKRATSIPSVRVKYDTDPLSKLADILFNLEQECKRLTAEIELRKQREEAQRNLTGERSISRDEFMKKIGLDRFVSPQGQTSDANVSDNDNDDDDLEDDDLQDTSELLDAPNPEE